MKTLSENVTHMHTYTIGLIIPFRRKCYMYSRKFIHVCVCVVENVLLEGVIIRHVFSKTQFVAQFLHLFMHQILANIAVRVEATPRG
jgi:hypothetical protein